MSNLLKSKLLLGVMTVAIMFVGAVAVNATTASASCSITSTLRLGSTGAEVVCLQTALGGLTADGNFGAKTKAAVIKFQTNANLTADGVFGPKSINAWLGNQGNAGNFPSGCTSASGFSTTNGASCAGSGLNLPTGCTSTAGFSPVTGTSCAASSSYPAGCTSTAGFSPTTGTSCASGSTVTTGGAGDISLSVTTNDNLSPAPEGATTQVVAFKGEATGSDIAVSNVKVTLQNTTPHSTSTRLDHYASQVDVYMGSTKVGSANVADFTKDGALYSATIPVSGAIVRVGNANKQTFSVKVTAISTMDSADATGSSGTDNFWTAKVTSVRYTDGTGLTLSQDPSGTVSQVFTFGKITTSGDLKLTVTQGSSTPAAGNVKVSDTSSTSGILMNQFVLKPTGANMTMTALGISETTTGTGTGSQMAQNLILKADGVQVAELDTLAAGASATSTADVFTLDSDLLMFDGTPVTFSIYAKVNQIGTSTFHQGDALTVSYNKTGTAIETTSGGSSVATKLTGSSTGNAQKFFSQGVNVSNFVSSVTPTTDTNGLKVSETYTISYDVTAFGNTYYVPKTIARTALTASTAAYGLLFSLESAASGSAIPTGTVGVSSISSTANTVGSAFEIPDGATRTFTAMFTVTKADDSTIASHGAITPPVFIRIQLDTLRYDTDSAFGTLASYTITPVQNYQAQDSQLQN